MVEIKINDVESLEAIANALTKNGYFCTTYIRWDGGRIDHYIVQLDIGKWSKSISPEAQNALKEIGRKAHGGR